MGRGSKLSSLKAYRLLFLAIWTSQTILMFVFMVIYRMPGGEFLSPVIHDLLMSVLALLSASYIIKKVRFKEVAVFLLFMFVYFFSMIGGTPSSEYLMDNIFTILFGTLPVLFVGVAFDANDIKLIKIINLSSCISVVLMIPFSFLYFKYAKERGPDDMSLAYSVLPHYCLLLTTGFREKNFVSLILAFAAFFLLVIFGTRGSMLIAGVYLVFEICILFVKNRKYRIPLALTLSGGVYYFVNKWETFFSSLAVGFESMDLNPRIFNRILSLDFFESEGRSDLLDAVINHIDKAPYWGYGMAGDRNFVGADSYVHNFYYEVICSYGYIGGYLFFVLLAVLFITAYIRSRNQRKYIIFYPLLFGSILKLLFSSSYLLEPLFFLLIGISMSICRNHDSFRLKYEKKSINNNQ